MNRIFRNSILAAILAYAGLSIAGCGGCGSTSVSGNTYQGNGGVVVVEFKSGGKAFVSTGPVSTTCSYTQNAKKVSLTCEGDTTVFTVDDDGALNGPPNGFLGRLTKKKN
jgi:hypothetical protein